MARAEIEALEIATANEIVRHYVRRELRSKDVSVSEIERDLKVSRGRLRRFLAGARPEWDLWETLAEFNAWCELNKVDERCLRSVPFAKAKPIPARIGANEC